MRSNHTPNRPPAFNLQSVSQLEAPANPALEANSGPWLWPQVLAYDQTTLIAGPPGVGKSFLALDIAARVSRGQPMPFSPTGPEAADVLLFAPEDSPQNTIAPRLRTLGADTSRIHLTRGLKNRRIPRESPNADIAADSLADSVSALMDAATSLPDCALIIIDPLAALLAASANNASHIRIALSQLAEFARESCIPILAIAHTQPARTAGRHRILGPAVLSVLPRTIWHLQHYQGHRALTPAKSNLASPPAFTFSLSARGLTWLESRPDLALDPSQVPTLDLADLPVFDEAREFLLTELNSGPRPANEMLALAKKVGFAPRTLRTAREFLGIKATRPTVGPDNPWIWTLPSQGCKIARAEIAT